MQIYVMFKNKQECFIRFKTMRHSRVVLDLIKHMLRVFWTASKTFHKNRVTWESEQRFKLWEEDISKQEKQAMPY